MEAESLMLKVVGEEGLCRRVLEEWLLEKKKRWLSEMKKLLVMMNETWTFERCSSSTLIINIDFDVCAHSPRVASPTMESLVLNIHIAGYAAAEASSSCLGYILLRSLVSSATGPHVMGLTIHIVA